jgi:hypothetical protein
MRKFSEAEAAASYGLIVPSSVMVQRSEFQAVSSNLVSMFCVLKVERDHPSHLQHFEGLHPVLVPTATPDVA